MIDNTITVGYRRIFFIRLNRFIRLNQSPFFFSLKRKFGTTVVPTVASRARLRRTLTAK